MVRVAVIGNAGGGKTTLCEKLSRAKALPFYPIDKIQWKPGWVRASDAEFAEQHAAILAQDRWIIDGWGSFEAIQARFEAADTIMLVDLPLIVHYWWSLKRQVRSLFYPRTDLPENCPMLPMTFTLLRMIWNIHWLVRPQLLALVASYQDRKQVLYLRSRRDIQQFLRVYCV